MNLILIALIHILRMIRIQHCRDREGIFLNDAFCVQSLESLVSFEA